MNPLSTASWQSQRESGNARVIALTAWIAIHLGRPIVRSVLIFIVGFYLLISAKVRRYSRWYLKRVLQREVGLGDIFRQLYFFATVAVDRLYFVAGKMASFSIELKNSELFDKHLYDQQGALLIVSHFGSFEIMRVLAQNANVRQIRIVIDIKHNATYIDVLRRYDPELLDYVIDAAQEPPVLAMQIKDALAEGHLIGMMGDRYRRGDMVTEVPLLGDKTHFPLSPWQLAYVLNAPVFLCYGVFQGGNAYTLHFEYLEAIKKVSRAERERVIAERVQIYTASLEKQLQQAPYNWFNFYDFWQDEPSLEQ